MRKNETRDTVALSDIHIGEDRIRKLDLKLVETLADSMSKQGLLQPISIRNRRDGYELISGRHRLEAARKLGWKSMRTEINYNLGPDDMLLAEIDENLVSGELDDAERAQHMVKRKEIYERKYPETKSGKAQALGMNKALGHNVVAKLAPTFVKATAATMNMSERSIERDVARGAQTRLDDVKGISLAKGVELDALAKLQKTDPIKRNELIDRAVTGEKVSAAPVLPHKTATKKEVLQTISLAAAPAMAKDWGRDRDPHEEKMRHPVCENTSISKIYARLGGEVNGKIVYDDPKEVGSAVAYADGVQGVSYDYIPAISMRSRVGDPIRLCLVSLYVGCPVDDDRGKTYAAVNLRTGDRWSLSDTDHICGGA